MKRKSEQNEIETNAHQNKLQRKTKRKLNEKGKKIQIMKITVRWRLKVAKHIVSE